MQSVRVGRNDPCPCGSGKKFKHCCLQRDFNARQPSPAFQRVLMGSSTHPPNTSPPIIHQHPEIVGSDAAESAADDGQKMPDASSVEVLPVEVGLDYTFPESFGIAEVTYILPAGQILALANRGAINADRLKSGMQIVLEDDFIATISGVRLYYEPPDPPVLMANGLWLSRVVGTIKHTAPAVLDVSWPGTTVTGTPDHPFFSVTRQAWLPAHELQVGEFLRTDNNLVAPVESVSKPRFGKFEVFNVEVERFHTYFVGKGGSGALVHNGGCIKRPIKYADAVSTLRLRGLSLTSGSKKLRALGLVQQATEKGFKFVDRFGVTRARWDYGTRGWGNHWHKFFRDESGVIHSLTDAGHIFDFPMFPKVHIPSM